MLFTKSFTIQTTHTVDAPLEDTMNLAHGIITWVSVFFPSGCHGLVNCVLYHGGHQVFPSIEGMTLMSDGTPIEWTEYYEFYQPPYQLKFKGWGISCTYDHVVTVRVAILPRRAVIASAIVDAIKSIFGILSPKRIVPTKEKESE